MESNRCFRMMVMINRIARARTSGLLGFYSAYRKVGIGVTEENQLEREFN